MQLGDWCWDTNEEVKPGIARGPAWMSSNQRAWSAQSRQTGRHFHNRHCMKPIPYNVEVSLAFADDQHVLHCQCWDLSLVSVVYSQVSQALLLPRTRFTLAYGDQVLPQDNSVCSKFFKFERSSKVVCVILPPADCLVCSRPWVYSEARKARPCHWVQEFKPDCKCEMHYKNREYGWRGIRLWNRLVLTLKSFKIRQTALATSVSEDEAKCRPRLRSKTSP